MIYGLLQEYSKVIDWYISLHKERKISLEVHTTEDRIEFLLTLDTPKGICIYGNYITIKNLSDKEFCSSVKKNIFNTTKRAIEEINDVR